MAKQDKVSKVRVSRKDSDEVFEATATEALRKSKAKTPLHLIQAQRDLKNAQAEEIVSSAKRKKK